MKSVFLVLVLSVWISLAGVAQSEITEHASEFDVARQISKTCEMIIVGNIDRTFPEVELVTTPDSITNQLNVVVSTYATLFSIPSLINFDGFEDDVSQALYQLGDLQFDRAETQDHVLASINEHINATTALIELQLANGQRNLVDLVNQDMRDFSTRNFQDESEPLPFSTPSPSLAESIIPEDHSQLVLQLIEENNGFALHSVEQTDLLSALGMYSSEASLEEWKTVNVPAEIAISFNEGEFILQPGATAQLKEIADLLAIYPELKLHIRPDFEAIETPLTMRRMRSIQVKLQRFGLSIERISNAFEEGPLEPNLIHIIVLNE